MFKEDHLASHVSAGRGRAQAHYIIYNTVMSKEEIQIPNTKYVIDTGAICLLMEAGSPFSVLERVLHMSAFLKPELYATHQPVVPIHTYDLVVCNIGDMEIRIYPAPVTLELPPDIHYLCAPFYA